MRPIFLHALIATLAAVPPAPAQAQAKDGTPATVQGGGKVTLGMLTCDLVRDTNLLVFSKESFACSFRASGGATEHYRGEISKLGADLEFKSGQVLKWAVLAPSAVGGPGALAGRYVGASAEATAVGGLGARVLVGGSRDQITLQPVSLSGQTGFGASVTLDALRLTPVGG